MQPANPLRPKVGLLALTLELYETLCAKSRCRHDPCVLDTFMSITDFMSGHKPRPWWEYTAERKRLYGRILEAARER